MSLRMASTVGGCMLRSMMHAGLHRCPFRYRELSSHDRQLRKRIFWCAYAIDRYLSQALGLPLGIQDSDIDVCAPGADEIHVPGSHRAHGLRMGLSTFNLDDRASSAPASSADAIQLPAEQSFGHESHRNTPSDSEPLQNKREIAFASYVESGKLTGRALELFHKSILVRSIRRSSVLFLITDVHKWWNSLSVDLQTLRPPTDQDAIADRPFNFGPFFTVLYQHLILLINRPSLSLSPSTPEFCSGLQTCIGAAREILTALKAQVDAKQALFWPGFLSAAWMSGLVLAFACQLRQYVLSKGLQPEDDNDPETRKKRRLHSHPVTRNSRLGSASFETTHNGTEHPSDKDDNTNDPGLGVSSISYSNEIQVSDNPPGLVQGGNRLLLSPTAMQSPEDRLFFPEGGSHSMMDFDLNMVDLLQGANFDNLFDMFGQQYPSF
ncbi:hypothetical protein APSETT444_001302 [Aspergillus pseudonomiae]